MSQYILHENKLNLMYNGIIQAVDTNAGNVFVSTISANKINNINYYYWQKNFCSV